MPEIGKEFKALAEVLNADGTNASFAVIDPAAPGHMRPVELADRYADAELLALPSSVPDNVRGYFDAARMLWVYGWLYYPFYTWASLHASICVEMTLKQRFMASGIELPGKRRTFEGMLHEAVDRGWVRPEGMTRIRMRTASPSGLAFAEFMVEEFGADAIPPAPTHDESTKSLKRYLDNVRRLRRRRSPGTVFVRAAESRIRRTGGRQGHHSTAVRIGAECSRRHGERALDGPRL